MLIMLWVELQRVVALREATLPSEVKIGKHSASDMVAWLLQKYAEVAGRVDNEHSDMVKKIIAVIGLKPIIVQTEQTCHAKAYTVLNQYLKEGEVDNDLAQILVQCLFQLSSRFGQEQSQADRQACQSLISALFTKRDSVQISSLLPLMVHPCLPYDNLCLLLKEIIYNLHNHHLQTLSNFITQNRNQSAQDLAQVLKVVVENIIKVLVARAGEQGPAQAIDLIKIIICSSEGSNAQLEEQSILQRQLIFTDALICHDDSQEQGEQANGGDEPRQSISARSLLLQAIK